MDTTSLWAHECDYNLSMELESRKIEACALIVSQNVVDNNIFDGFRRAHSQTIGIAVEMQLSVLARAEFVECHVKVLHHRLRKLPPLYNLL